MAKPDVRVRLSAEGVEEVVNALRKVALESRAAAKAPSEGFLDLNDILAGTSDLLAGLGLALSVAGFVNLVRGAVDGAAAIYGLGVKVGASTENLSALDLAAHMTGTTLDNLSTGLQRQNAFLDKAISGNTRALGTLQDLGVELEDFKGKDTAERFEILARAITKVPEAATRGGRAIQIFGKSGQNLIPIMKKLADEGLLSLIDRARELGVLIDTDVADAARQIKTDFRLLELQTKGLSIQLMKGLAPNLSQSLQILSGSLDQTTESWEKFGWGVGITIKWVVGVVANLFDFLGTYIGLFVVQADAGIRAFIEIVKFNFDEAKKITADANAYIADEEAKLSARMQARFALASKIDMPAGTPPPDEDLEDPAELASRKAAAKRAAMQREIATIRALGALRNAAEQRAFEEGLQSIETYYADRRKIAEDALAEELRLIEEQRVLLGAEIDPVKAAEEEVKLDERAAEATLATEEEIAALIHEETKDVRALAADRLVLEQQLLEAQGQRVAAQRLGFDEQIRQADVILRQSNATAAEREAFLAQLRASLEMGADFEEAKDAAERALTEMAQARADIQAQVDAGLKSAVAGEAEILTIEQERLVVLRELAQVLLAAAEATGDPAKIEAALAYAASIREIGYSAEVAEGSLDTLGATAIDATKSALADFFANGAEGAANFKEKFQQMVAGVLSALKNLVGEMMAAAIMKKALALFGEGGEVAAATAVVATGGLIRGPGTGTSDSILARLSNKEFVVRAAMVEQPGVLDHLRSINRSGARALGEMPGLITLPTGRFAEGGLVEAGGGLRDATVGGEITVGLEEGLVARQMETPEGQRVVLRVINNNRRAVASLLGG